MSTQVFVNSLDDKVRQYSGDRWNVVFILIGVYLAYQLASVIYVAYFGPLSRYPGPKTWALTNLPSIRQMWVGNEAFARQKFHETYGPVVRVGPTELSYADAQAWRDIYGHRVGGKQSFHKDPFFYTKGVNNVPSLIVANDEDHSRMRKVLSHAFSDKALKEQEPLFQEWANVMVNKMREKADDPSQKLNLVSYLNFTTFDIMGDLTFGEPLGMLAGSDYIPWVKTIFASIKLGSRFIALRKIPYMKSFMGFVLSFPALRGAQTEHFKFSADRVDRRLAKGQTAKPDLWAQILKRSGNELLTRDEMHSNASLFMTAGTETTATWLSGLTYYLLRNPGSMSRLMDEIRSTFRHQDDITIEALARMEYVNACLEEGLRLYPPVPVGLPRRVPAGGAAISGSWVPGGTTVSVHQLSANRSSGNFVDPSSFAPERWLSPSHRYYSDRFVDDSKASLQPFSTGPRNCLGRNLAYHEARLLLVSTLLNFELELCEESRDWADQQVFLLWEKHPLMVRLKSVKT